MPRDLMEMLAPLFDQATRMGDIEGSDNLLFPKRFSKKHPRIASMVEGAVLGAALTKPSETPGEAISNVAQAVLGIPEFKKQKQMQKVLAPLGMIKQGLEMQKLQSGIGVDEARAEWLRTAGERVTQARPRDRYYSIRADADGVLRGINRETGELEAIPGEGDFHPAGSTAGTALERFIAKRNAERAAEDPPRGPMDTVEEAAYRSRLYGQKSFASGLGGAEGREIVTGPIRDRNELLRTEKGFADKEVARLEKMDDFEYMMENEGAGEGDLANALAQLRAARSEYIGHLRMGGTLSWEDFKKQQQGTNPFGMNPAGVNPFRPDKR